MNTSNVAKTRPVSYPATDRLPLQGVRIADFSWVGTGPYGAELLGFLGAEVIKVESRRRPDQMREYARSHGWDDEAYDLDASPYFCEMNLGKLGVGLNLKHPRAVELARQLAAVSDVVIENMTPGTFARLGLGYETLRGLKPDIILCSLSGRGAQGGGPAYAGIFAAIGGLSYLSGYPDGLPGSMRMPVDLTCGAYAAVSILAALWHRAQTGEGQFIDLACQEVTTCLVGDAILRAAAGLGNQPRAGNEHPRWSPHDCYPCQGEDEWISIAIRSGEEWRALCQAIGRPELAEAPETATAEERRGHKPLVDAAIGAWTATLPKYDAMHRLQAAGVPAVPSFHLRDLEHDPHLRAQRFFQPLDQPGIGLLSVLGPPWRFRRHALRPVGPSPLMAQHNDYVVRDLLGIPPGEIERLVAEGVVEQPTPRPGGETLFQIRPAAVAPAVTAPTAAPRAARPPAERAPHAGPLAGVTVVEVATSSAAGYCGRILRDLGARVLKVTSPAAVRDLAPGDELSMAYENAGKLSVTLDITSAHGEELLGRLVARADMVITDEQPAPAGPGARAPLPERLAAAHPTVVVLSITPFGLDGPYAAFRCAPLNSYHAGGQGYLFPPSLEDLDRPPLKSAGNAGEYEAATGAAVAGIAALFGRHFTGEGEIVDCSKQQWGVSLNRPFHSRYTVDGIVETRATQAYPWGGVFACADGDLLLLAMQDNQWEGLLRAIGDPALAADERFTTPGKRRANGRALRQIIARWMRVQPRAAVLATLARDGTPAGPVQTPAEILEYHDYRARGFLQPLPLPTAPQARAPGLPFRLGASPAGIAGPPPLPGDHNQLVYGDLLGLTEQEIAALRHAGIV